MAQTLRLGDVPDGRNSCGNGQGGLAASSGGHPRTRTYGKLGERTCVILILVHHGKEYA